MRTADAYGRVWGPQSAAAGVHSSRLSDCPASAFGPLSYRFPEKGTRGRPCAREAGRLGSGMSTRGAVTLGELAGRIDHLDFSRSWPSCPNPSSVVAARLTGG